MRYLHDVWVNWFEGEENGYNVCEFYEWRKTESPELLDQVPLVKLDKEVYDYIENDLAPLPKSLLTYIQNHAFYRKNHERVVTEYCAIVTDGERIIVFDTIGYDLPIRKSRLIPRHEQQVFEMVDRMRALQINHDELNQLPLKEKTYHILSPHPNEMVGLTRSERMFKQIVYMAVDQMSVATEEEIRYWYSEWNPKSYEEIKELTKENLWDRLYSELKEGWTYKHYQFGKIIIKGQPFYEKLWKMEEDELKIATN